MLINRLCVIGVGLIGGSLARALRRAGACGEIIGCARRRDDLEHALRLGVIDHYSTEPAAAVRDSDMVVVAVPVSANEAVLRDIAGDIHPRAVVTDVGSVKGQVVRDACAVLGERLCRFVPGHPIAGTERSGVDASFAELFEHHRVVLTPLAETDLDALARVRRMWQATGAEVEELAVGLHDELLAATSHVPHLLAYALMNTLGRVDASLSLLRFAGGGLRDVTRIAGSSPALWRDILSANRDPVLRVTGEFRDALGKIEAAILADSGAALLDQLTRAHEVREHYSRQYLAQLDRRTGEET